MLVEVRSAVLRVGAISFRSGLNVVLGDENATNSIGKSTLLMIIDFAFGGESLLSHHTDLVAELGHHDYFFTFNFDSEDLRFRRGTHTPSVIHVCNDGFEPIRAIDVQEYTATLKKAYGIDLSDLSFRSLVGLYLRVWGKENLSVKRPLHVVSRQRSRECVDTLLKTFDKYASLRELTAQLNAALGLRKALAEARRRELVPSLGKKEYRSNQKRIAEFESEISDIRDNLARYATSLSEIVNHEVLQLKLEKDRLLAQRLIFSGRLERVRGNLAENRHIKSSSFRDLVEFFPNVNQERLARVEEFHNGVAQILRNELIEAEAQLEGQMAQLEHAISELDGRMESTLNKVEQPAHLVDRVVDATMSLQRALEANQIYETARDLDDSTKRLRGELTAERNRVLAFVQDLLNDGMRRLVSQVFGEDRKSPLIKLRDSSYEFDVHEDTGTGTAYASLVIFDLTVFLSTQLPVIAHDSLLFKNIENDSVALLMQVYLKSTKQSFIAIDEIQKYGPIAEKVLRDRSVIRLDSLNVLYVKDWRR